MRTGHLRDLLRHGGGLIGAALAVAAVVAVTAFSGSYQHQYELNIINGQTHWVAGMMPLSVEGLIAAATLVIWFAAAYLGKRAPWPVYAVLAAGIVQTAMMNLAADHRWSWPWIGPEISVWPAVAFVGAYEMAVWAVRQRVTVNEGQSEQAEPVPDLYELGKPNGHHQADAELAEILAEAGAHDPRPVEDNLDNPATGLVHTCNSGRGPLGGKKTPGCPRCDAILSGAVASKRRKR